MAEKSLAKKDDIKSWLDSRRDGFIEALPDKKMADQFMRVALTQFVRNPDLAKCTKESLITSMIQCAQFGLLPDGRNAHLIPYGSTCTVIFDYKGLISLAKRSGLKNIYAEVVRQNDVFDYAIVDGKKTLKHVINYRQPRGDAELFYSVSGSGEDFDVEIMSRDDVDKIRSRSKAGKSGPWVTDYEEMGKKTVLRRHSKRWNISQEFAEALTADDDLPDDIIRFQQAKPARGDDPIFTSTIPKDGNEDVPAKEEKSESSEGGMTDKDKLVVLLEEIGMKPHGFESLARKAGYITATQTIDSVSTSVLAQLVENFKEITK